MGETGLFYKNLVHQYIFDEVLGEPEKIGFIQIAGLVARRIYCPLKIGDKLKAGEIFGMIRFGSRLDVFLPSGVAPKVLLGQVAVAGETILADMKERHK